MGSYVETPQLDETSGRVFPGPLCDSREPVTSVLNYLTNRTWHKAAERSLKDHGIFTVGDLCRMTELSAGSLKGLKPPSNVITIREAMKKFDKILFKREKIQRANNLLNMEREQTAEATLQKTNGSSCPENESSATLQKTNCSSENEASAAKATLQETNNSCENEASAAKATLQKTNSYENGATLQKTNSSLASFMESTTP